MSHGVGLAGLMSQNLAVSIGVGLIGLMEQDLVVSQALIIRGHGAVPGHRPGGQSGFDAVIKAIRLNDQLPEAATAALQVV